jgi:hypothetical protein
LPNEKRVALKNLHLVNLVSGISSFIPFHFNELQAEPYKITVDFGRKSQIFTMGIVFPGNIVEHVLRDSSFRGFKLSQLGSGEVDLLRKQWIEKEYKDPDKVENYIRDLDFKNFFIPNSKKAALSFDNEQQSSSMKALLVAINERPSRSYSKFSIIQENGRGRIMGGSTFILRN